MPTAKPIIGKNIIETLTSGMYEDPRFIYREYIQNSADQIDIAVEEEILKSKQEGKITIQIDTENKTISIEDNATGIKSVSIRKFLGDVANSEKEFGTRKGFRGIGRLGGLGYCKKLIFQTTYKGEGVMNTMTLNAETLKRIIENKQDKSDAASVISVITRIESTSCSVRSHFFKVILIDVTSDSILNINSVYQYLSMVAPLQFSSKFEFRKNINDHFLKRGFLFDEYSITLNNDPVYKAYKNELLTSKEGDKPIITSIGFFDVKDDSSQLLAIGWYGISSKINEVIEKINPERGIRIKKNNITIGNEQTLLRRFKVERTNLRYIGEIHVLGEGFIPNARRDYFNDNKTIEQFEKSLEIIFEDFESKLPHKASDLHNRLKNIKDFRSTLKSYRKERAYFSTTTEQEQRLTEVLKTLDTAKKAEKKINRIRTEANLNPQLMDLFKSIINSYDYFIDEEKLSDIYAQKIYPPLEFKKLSPPQSKLLNEVVVFLQDELGHRKADFLIKKLQSKYN